MTGTASIDGRPLRVLHLHFGKEGGAERFFVNLAGGLAGRGVEQRFVIRPGRSWDDRIAPLGPVMRTRYRKASLWGKVTEWRVRRLEREWKPDAILAWMARAAPLIPRERDAVSAVRLGDFASSLKHFGRCDAVIGNTPQIVAGVKALGWQRPAITISNFARPVAPQPVPRAALDTPPDAFVVCGAGRFVPRKGMDVLIRAVAKVPDAWLWLVGDDRERATIEALIDEVGIRDRTRLTGWVDEPIHHMAAADALVVPSRLEPLGNVVLEGWQAGLPVVSTRSEGPGWFMRDGIDGRLVEIDDVDAIAAALATLRDDPAERARLAEGGRMRLEEVFGQDRVLDRYIRLFKGDLGEEGWLQTA